MGFTSWRGTVGVIKPTRRPGSLEELIRLLPEGIGVIPLFLNIREGTVEEFKSALKEAEEKVAELADSGADLVHQEGAGFFMLEGFAREREIVQNMERTYGVPVVTSGMVQVDAMRALGMRRVVSVAASTGPEVDDALKAYLRDAGFDVPAVASMDVPFDQLGNISEKAFYTHTKEVFLRHERVDGIHILGSGWRLLGILDVLERDLGVPVVHAVTARAWAIQERLRVRQPTAGYGRLLAEMPPARTSRS